VVLLEMFVIAGAVVLQFTSAGLALRLTAVTGHRAAWVAIALAVTLMGTRRLQSLLGMLLQPSLPRPNFLFEVNGLVISMLMLYGMYRIRPLFVSLARAESEQREMALRLNALSEEQAKLITELQDALGKIRTLRGMLPICSACKKIRDDKGFWNQLEAYVHEHSEAEFSHAICPDCLRRLYPEVAEEVLQNVK